MVTSSCSTCARILHTRWVEIVILEHQWMHERGTCGCGVVFPALQQPRETGKVRLGGGGGGGGNGNGGNTSTSDDSTYSTRGRDDDSTAAAGQVLFDPESYSRTGMDVPQSQEHQQPHPSNQSTKSKNKQARRKRNKPDRKKQKDIQADLHSRGKPHNVPDMVNSTKPHALAWDLTLSPLIEIDEPVTSTSSSTKPSTSIAVRLSSQYGAEWIPEHAKLHAAGNCNCPVKFDTYKPEKLTVRDIAEHAPGLKIDAPIKALQKLDLRNSDVMIWRINKENPAAKQIPWPVEKEEFGFKSVAQAEAWLAAEGISLGDIPDQVFLNQHIGRPLAKFSTDPYSGVSSFVQPPKFDGHGSLQYPLIAYGYDVVQTSSTQIASQAAANRPVTASNPEQQGRANGQVIATRGVTKYRQKHGLPLIGWPLGAGPEGGQENSHSPAWNMCLLSRPALERSRSCPDFGETCHAWRS
ncbi:hypothetical protein SCUP234_01975 [Seiridium cupressi]